ncbi:DNA replication licensing factor mcm10 [Drechslerella dactyloides]|uniref:DNA replication licensing factor mcm10 n=1 Tax=Drechslerella dactyloides TaxID=74499 RepID=A0AAD6NLP5_DREDA|nr:DNA replication licensing factor mcm10 [Drechslerella dactyloides]
MANNDLATQWPPASPKDVLRLTPKKPTNPLHSSPLRNARNVSPTRAGRAAASALDNGDSDSDATTSEEDEEALQLQLKAIEMKLKLKRLQKDKKRKAAATTERPNPTSGRVTPPPPSFESTAPDVQVPGSPSPRKRNTLTTDANPPPSPSRVLLGIDKGLKARDVSLKRAPGMTNLIAEPPRKPQFASSTASTANALRNITKDTANPFSNKTAAAAAVVAPVKTFSERIAEQRAGIQAKETRAKENEKLRSKGWNLEPAEDARTAASSQVDPPTAMSTTAPSRPSNAMQSSTGSRLQTQRATAPPKEPEPPKPLEGPSSISGPGSEAAAETKAAETADLGAGFDSFSGMHLSRRIIPHTQLARHLNEKEIFPIPRLLKTVHSPDYDPPDVPGDWVVMAIVCSKSEPRDVAREGAGKYIVVQITDLKWEMELFFFGSAFQKYYRVGVGTVLAILNPNIMKPRNQDTGKFSLTLSDNNDTLLEVGVARDLGACKARKRDGKECGSWIDKRRTEFCDFHVEQTISKVRSGRMEVNSIGKLYSPPRKGQGLRPKRNFLRGGRQEKEDGLLPVGPVPDLPQRLGGGGGNVYSMSVSTARLIDHDISGDPSYQAEKDERMKRALARREKERDLAKSLLAGGNANTGMDYLKANLDDTDGKKLALGGKQARPAPSASSSAPADPTRRLLGADARSALLDDFRASTARLTAANISLSPVKSKRKSAEITATSRDSPSPPPVDERANKRTRKANGDDGPVGWAQADVRRHLERNVALTSTGGLRQTTIGWGGGSGARSRSRSRSPVKRLPPTLVQSSSSSSHEAERPGSPTKGVLKGAGAGAGGRPRRDSKTVTFASLPKISIEGDDSDDDLEILGMA